MFLSSISHCLNFVQIDESIFNHVAIKLLVIRHRMYAVKDRLIKKILYSSDINQKKTVESNKSKVMFTLEQATKAQMGSRRIDLLFLKPTC